MNFEMHQDFTVIVVETEEDAKLIITWFESSRRFSIPSNYPFKEQDPARKMKLKTLLFTRYDDIRAEIEDATSPSSEFKVAEVYPNYEDQLDK